MSKNRRRRAFTLIEVLIVVIIMAVLAATIIPQFSSSTRDAKESSLQFNLHTMRSQIEMYKMHHLSNYPPQADFENQMTKTTDIDGTVGVGAGFPYGPYMTEVPANPFDDSTDVEAGTGIAVVGVNGGWQYDELTGGIWANHTDAVFP